MKLLLLGTSPFFIGKLLEYAIMDLNWYGMRLSIISIIFCIYWFVIGYKSYDFGKSMKESILLGNGFATICFFLVLFQQVILGRYMLNFIGHVSQIFFLPMIRISTWVYRIPTLFIRMTMYSTIGFVIISYFLMIGIYYFGYSVAKISDEGPIPSYRRYR